VVFNLNSSAKRAIASSILPFFKSVRTSQYDPFRSCHSNRYSTHLCPPWGLVPAHSCERPCYGLSQAVGPQTTQTVDVLLLSLFWRTSFRTRATGSYSRFGKPIDEVEAKLLQQRPDRDLVVHGSTPEPPSHMLRLITLKPRAYRATTA